MDIKRRNVYVWLHYSPGGTGFVIRRGPGVTPGLCCWRRRRRRNDRFKGRANYDDCRVCSGPYCAPHPPDGGGNYEPVKERLHPPSARQPPVAMSPLCDPWNFSITKSQSDIKKKRERNNAKAIFRVDHMLHYDCDLLPAFTVLYFFPFLGNAKQHRIRGHDVLFYLAYQIVSHSWRRDSVSGRSQLLGFLMERYEMWQRSYSCGPAAIFIPAHDLWLWKKTAWSKISCAFSCSLARCIGRFPFVLHYRVHLIWFRINERNISRKEK